MTSDSLGAQNPAHPFHHAARAWMGWDMTWGQWARTASRSGRSGCRWAGPSSSLFKVFNILAEKTLTCPKFQISQHLQLSFPLPFQLLHVRVGAATTPHHFSSPASSGLETALFPLLSFWLPHAHVLSALYFWTTRTSGRSSKFISSNRVTPQASNRTRTSSSRNHQFLDLWRVISDQQPPLAEPSKSRICMPLCHLPLDHLQYSKENHEKKMCGTSISYACSTTLISKSITCSCDTIKAYGKSTLFCGTCSNPRCRELRGEVAQASTQVSSSA
ncbi:hypothetical protein QC761_000970 [Podospora bellae-mahoneyi]|uniref:Uncharacterized protein n=1 Tax=Podospora bellae-mahoneyi TaxID=2093777 RepID=A0ABR0FQB2_9PEZI|nr:hypothetical protein QC761_000970 [Podospora bellae-mahoneyi]